MTPANSPPTPPTIDPLKPPDAELTLIRAGAIDGFGQVDLSPRGSGTARPGAVVIAGGRVIAAGPTADIERQYAADARHTIDLPERLLLPGLINAHTHLELTAIGPQPYGGEFIGWVAMLRKHFPGEGKRISTPSEAEWFAAAAAEGARQSKAAGVQAVGDITRFAAVAHARRVSGLNGVSFIEVFGMGPPWDAQGLGRMREPAGVDGFQPHAPYSAGPALFDAACSSGLPVSCHLAETLDEARLIARGDGPFLDLLQAMGKWSPDFATHYGHCQSPVQWMQPYLRRASWLLAHCNYVSDDDIQILADTDASVAYCPVASEYFGHKNHRYRDMLDAGINVCLGTDSMICQPPPDIEAQPLGVLPQMRRLYQRDHTDPALLLKMATTHGRRALQLDGRLTRLATIPFDPDATTDPLSQVLLRNDPVEALDCAALVPRKKEYP